jgi:hypothetical protein
MLSPLMLLRMSWMHPNNVVPSQAMYLPKPPMTRELSLSEFIMNRICEFIKSGIQCDNSFRERHLQSASNDVIDLIWIIVAATQIYNTRGSGDKYG